MSATVQRVLTGRGLCMPSSPFLPGDGSGKAITEEEGGKLHGYLLQYPHRVFLCENQRAFIVHDEVAGMA